MNSLAQDFSGHKSVLLTEVSDSFSTLAREDRPALMLDCTLGAGGHAEALLQKFPNLYLVGLDCDDQAIARASRRLETYSSRCFLMVGNFRNLESLTPQISAGLSSLDIKFEKDLSYDGVLLDLGYSSYQVDDPSRGLSFLNDGPLDMRLNLNSPLTASDVVNGYSFAKLKSVLSRGGMGSGAGVLADAIVKNRPINSTKELAQLCADILVRQKRNKKTETGAKKNFATVPFQALRIEVNDELRALQEFLDFIPSVLAPAGRLAVISFHSLEDRFVAKAMRTWGREERLPVRQVDAVIKSALGKLLTRKAILPSENEINENSRSRSARMRVFEKNNSIRGSVCQ